MTKGERLRFIGSRAPRFNDGQSYDAPGQHRAAKGWGRRMVIQAVTPPQSRKEQYFFNEELNPFDPVKLSAKRTKALLRDTHFEDTIDNGIHYLTKIMIRWEDRETFKPYQDAA